MNTIEEKNVMIAEFLQWQKRDLVKREYHPKQLGSNFRRLKQEIKENHFTLPENHPIVQNMYTERPGFNWFYIEYDEQPNYDLVYRELFFEPRELLFHIDWNWLILAIEKIESIGYSVNIGRIKTSITEIGSDRDIFSFVCGNIKKKIEITYNVIIQFIEWYNQNKQP